MRVIPPQLYIAVAELLAWLYRLENGVGNETSSPVFIDATEIGINYLLLTLLR